MPVNQSPDESKKVDVPHLITTIFLILLTGAFWTAVCGGVLQLLT